MADDLFAPGTVVHRYRLEGVIGMGGMGTVYRATHLDSGAVVAVKALHPHVARRLEHQKRFLREARAAMATHHPNVVTIHEVFSHAGAPMYAMELLDGETLAALLAREKRIPLERLARIMLPVTSAVGTAHAVGVVHRDLKPDNIFLPRGHEANAKVLDFGVAKLTATQGALAETAALTKTGALMGTPFYMSPEQAFGEKRIDHRADIWSLGVILYTCLSGTLPTYGEIFTEVLRLVVAADFPPIASLCPGLPADVAALVGRMLQREPAARPADLREVYTLLQRYADAPAPAFGIAVAPLFDELGADDESVSGVAAARAAPAQTPSPSALRLAPSRLVRSAPTPSGAMPGGATPTGTIAMAPVAATVNEPPRRTPWFAVAAAVVVVAAAVAAALLLGR